MAGAFDTDPRSYVNPQILPGLNNIADRYRQAQIDSNRQAAFGALQNGASYDDVAKALLSVGDTDAGLGVARLAESSKLHAANLSHQKVMEDLARDAQNRPQIMTLPAGPLGLEQRVVAVNPRNPSDMKEIQLPGTAAPAQGSIIGNASQGERITGATVENAPLPPATAPTKAPTAPGSRNEDFLTTLPPQWQTTIKKLADYDLNPNSFSPRPDRSGISPRQRILEAVSQYDPTYDQKNYATYQLGLNRFTSGPQGDKIRALDVANMHLDTVAELGKALNNGNIQLFNKIANAYKEQTGQAAPTNLATAAGVAGQEVVKAIVANGGGEREREEAQKRFSNIKSWDQLSGSIQTYQKLFGGQIEGFRTQYEQATNRKDFDKRLGERTQRMLKELREGKTPGENPKAGTYNWTPNGLVPAQ